MTQETPAKVLSLLGVACASMFLLFAVSYSNASFTKTEVAFPDTFNPDRVVAALDNAAYAYNGFVQENVVQPWQQSYAIMNDNVSYIIDEASPSILAYTGLTALAQVPADQPARARVAGASTQENYSQYYPSDGGGFSIDSLYALFSVGK